MQNLTLTTDDGFPLPVLHVRSTKPGARPLVLIQEIFGLNASLRAAAVQWAEQGFDVLCPDLFARQQQGVDLDPRQPEQFQAGVALMMGLDQDRATRDLDTARAWFAARDPQARVATLGYCLGGRLAVKMALSTPVAAAVSYYGVGLEDLLPAAPGSRIAPTLLHVAGADAFVPPEALAQIRTRAAGLPAVTLHEYPGCQHAFARPDGEHHDAAAAATALQRTLAFLHVL